MSICGIRGLLPTLLITLSVLSRADVPPEVVDRGKKATALVEIEGGKGFGSAFCVSESGLFITNDHVVTALGSRKLSLILRPGEKDQKKLVAKVVRSDVKADLALLKAENPGPLTVLPLGGIGDLIETMSVTAFGFPFGTDLSLRKEDYPSVSVSTGHITALRKAGGLLQEIQLDASLNPGNSGGPVLNGKGQVIGVVRAGIPGAAVNFAIPVSEVAHFLEKAELVFTPPTLTSAQQHDSREFVISVETLHPTDDIRVEMTLSAGQDDHRTFTARQVAPHKFVLQAVPVPPVSGPHSLKVTAKDDQTEIVCRVKDQNIRVGGQSVPLSKIRRIERGEKTVVTFADNQTRVESVAGLESIEAQSLGVTAVHNFSRVTSLIIEDVQASAPSVNYKIVARQAGRVIAEHSGAIAVETPGAVAGIGKATADVELLLCSFDSDEIKRFNGRTGAFIDDFASGSGLSRPSDLTLGPDNNLYVLGSKSGTVLRYNGRTGQFIDTFVSARSVGGMVAPSALAFGPDGSLYVSSTWTQDVKRFDGKTGAYLGSFIPPGDSGLQYPGYMLFGPDGNLYVGSQEKTVKRYNGRTGAYLGDFVSSNEINNPRGFCFGADGRFYLCSYESKEIKRFDGKTGAFLDNFISAEGLGNVSPVSLCFGPDANLYVSTRGNEVRRFNGKTGAYIDSFASGNGINFPGCMLFRPSPRP